MTFLCVTIVDIDDDGDDDGVGNDVDEDHSGLRRAFEAEEDELPLVPR